MKRLVNGYEKLTHDVLKPVLDRFDLSIYPKVRVADVIDPDTVGATGALKTYALKAHFDFVICRDEWNPVYAIEFDGPLHAASAQAERDLKKDELCQRDRMPILRIHSAHLSKDYTDMTLLGWMVEIAEMQRVFDQEQEAGRISWNEDFDPFNLMSMDPDEPRYPYWISGKARVRIERLHATGRIHHPSSSGFIGLDSRGRFVGAELMAVTPGDGVLVKAEMRQQQFPVPFGDLLQEILAVQLAQKVELWIKTGNGAEPLSDIYSRASALRKSLQLRSSHSVGDVTNLWMF